MSDYCRLCGVHEDQRGQAWEMILPFLKWLKRKELPANEQSLDAFIGDFNGDDGECVYCEEPFDKCECGDWWR